MKNRLLASLVSGVAICMAAAAPTIAQGAPTTGPAQTAPTAGSNQAIEGVAALVNDEVISYTDVRNRIRLILLSLGAQPSEESIAEAERRAIESLVEEKLQVQEFIELTDGGTIEDVEIDEQLAQIAQRNGATLPQFVANLQASGVNVQTMRDQIRADIAWTALIRGRFARQIRVSELRVDSTLERLINSQHEPQYRIGEIFLYAPDTASQQVAMQRATTLQRQIEQGAPFELVAQQFSAAPSASAGGDLGWLTTVDMRTEIRDAVAGATPPVLLPPIQSETGVYLIALLGKREPTDTTSVQLNMRQITSTASDAEAKLAELKSGDTSCSALQSRANDIGDLTINDMGIVEPDQLAGQFRGAVENLDSGQASDVLDVGGNKMLLVVCERSIGGGNIPSKDAIRDQLFDTEISMMADRYLRDIKRDATIVMR